jgi:DNA-binding PadR family transcriptional regulator
MAVFTGKGPARLGERETEVNKTQVKLLDVLADGKWWYGLDLRNAAGISAWSPVYVHTHRLEEAGLIESRAEPYVEPHIGVPRRLYRITESGRRSLVDGRAAPPSLVSLLLAHVRWLLTPDLPMALGLVSAAAVIGASWRTAVLVSLGSVAVIFARAFIRGWRQS